MTGIEDEIVGLTVGFVDGNTVGGYVLLGVLLFILVAVTVIADGD